MKLPPVARMPRRLHVALALFGLSFAAVAQTSPDQILLKDYKPRSIFNLPETRVEQARFPVIDVHTHDYAPANADVDRWMYEPMDETNDGLMNAWKWRIQAG